MEVILGVGEGRREKRNQRTYIEFSGTINVRGDIKEVDHWRKEPMFR